MKELSELVADLDGLLSGLELAEEQHADAIQAVAPEHRLGAVNLVHYAALRQRDIRGLQNDLLDLGVTSLATTEADVRAKIMAARNVVSALMGAPALWDLETINKALDEGDQILAENAEAVLGPPSRGDSTRIMVTLPSEAADDPQLVESFVAAGMDIARINTAHDDEDAWARMAAHVRAAADRLGRATVISMDVPGPKLRTGPIADAAAVGRARVTHDDTGALLAPARLWLTDAASPTPAPPPPPAARRPTLVAFARSGWLAERRVRHRISLTDVRGRRREFRIVAAGPGGVLAECQRNTYLADGATIESGLSSTRIWGIPPVPQRLSLTSGDTLVLTDDLTEHVLAELARVDAGDLGLILKIETRQGFESLPRILLAGMRHRRLGVMIARGDLAVEVGFERLSEVPRQILSLCEAAHVPVIWATQVLESMAKTGQPSRAEITDAAAGQRAECVMLNKGPHIVEAIEALNDILNRVGEVQRKSRTLMRRIHSWDGQ